MRHTDLYGPLSDVVPRIVVVRYKRPLILAIAGSVFVESILFVLYGVVLYPEGSLLIKALWTIVFCGFGMGSAVGALIVLLIVDHMSGAKAIFATTVIAALTLGVGCNVLCFNLDMNYFNYFGGRENSISFIASGIILSIAGGLGLGWFLFSERGQTFFSASLSELEDQQGQSQI